MTETPTVACYVCGMVMTRPRIFHGDRAVCWSCADTDNVRITTWSWMKDASCIGSPLDWFPSEDEDHTAQMLVCHNCNVRVECLTSALTLPRQHGIWGGFTAKERLQMKQRRRDK